MPVYSLFGWTSSGELGWAVPLLDRNRSRKDDIVGVFLISSWLWVVETSAAVGSNGGS